MAQLFDQSAQRADTQRLHESVPAGVIDGFATLESVRQRPYRLGEGGVDPDLVEFSRFGGSLTCLCGVSVGKSTESLLGGAHGAPLLLAIEPFVHAS